MLVRLVSARASLLIIGGPSGCGKTTLLEAVLPSFPATDRRIRLRGAAESFGWSRRSEFDPQSSVIVAEEISGHLPSYLWGPAVGRFLELGRRGAALVATGHAAEPAGVVSLLSGYPLRLPIGAVTAFDLIVRLGPGVDAPVSRSRLDAAWVPAMTPGGGVVFDPVGLDQDDERLPARLRQLLGG